MNRSVLPCVHSRVVVAGISVFHSIGILHYFLIVLVLEGDGSPAVKSLAKKGRVLMHTLPGQLLPGLGA